MTRDEAISIMNVIVHMLEPQYDTDRIEEAVEMAIKALEQQPTDAVDRVTIKEYLESFGTAYELGKEKGLDIALDILGKYTEEGNEKIIRDLPSKTPQPYEDCVSRSAVLAIAGDSCLDLDSYEDTREFCDEIQALPPVTPPHPKVGHWISLDTGKPSHLKDGMTTEGVKCSECGEWLIASVEYACYGRYCPNCGSYNGGAG